MSLLSRPRAAGRRASAPSPGLGRGPAYRPALDGVRAIAVVSVMLYHAGVSWARGGFLGVDVFFVLSGYLITSLLVTEWDRWGSIDVVEFYRRRARRLLPALFLVTTAIAVWAAFAAKADRLATIRADGVATLLYVANWRFILVKASYFDQFGDPSPFRHTWSLAIEEQYYLVFPLLLVALLAWSRRRHWLLPTAIGVLAAASVAEMALLYQPGVDTSRIYFGTDTRIHELLIGSLLGVLATAWRTRAQGRRRLVSPRVAAIVAVPGLVAVLAAMTLLTDQSAFLYLGGFALVCLATAVLILGIEDGPGGPVGQLLSLPPVAWVGMVSYGLYLWHWPIFIALSPERTDLDGTRLVLLRFAATFVAAAASFYLVERPIRRGVLTRVPALVGRGLVSLALPATLIALIASTTGATSAQLPDSPFGPGAPPADKLSLLVVGDSVGASLTVSFPKGDFPDWTVSDETATGCGLAAQHLVFNDVVGDPNPACEGEEDRWSRAVEVTHPDAVVLSLGPWEVFDHYLDGGIVRVDSDAYRAYLMDRLKTARRVLTRDGARLFIPTVPCYSQPSYQLQGVDIAPIRNDPARAAVVNDVLALLAKRHDDVTLIDDASWLCPGGQEVADYNGIQLRKDGVHYTVDGGAVLWRQVLMPVIETAVTETADDRTRVYLVGDSVPLGLSNRFPAADHPDLLVADSTLLGCYAFPYPSLLDGETQPVPDGCEDWAASLPAAVERFRPQVGVVFAGIGEQFDKLVDGRTIRFGTDEHDAWLADQMTTRIDLFRDLGVPVVVVTSVP
jgi:peptidoglycan/LPS O-acetylase OafA/YrhL